MRSCTGPLDQGAYIRDARVNTGRYGGGPVLYLYGRGGMPQGTSWDRMRVRPGDTMHMQVLSAGQKYIFFHPVTDAEVGRAHPQEVFPAVQKGTVLRRARIAGRNGRGEPFASIGDYSIVLAPRPVPEPEEPLPEGPVLDLACDGPYERFDPDDRPVPRLPRARTNGEPAEPPTRPVQLGDVVDLRVRWASVWFAYADLL